MAPRLLGLKRLGRGRLLACSRVVEYRTGADCSLMGLILLSLALCRFRMKSTNVPYKRYYMVIFEILKALFFLEHGFCGPFASVCYASCESPALIGTWENSLRAYVKE